jgi:hypothetical protein
MKAAVLQTSTINGRYFNLSLWRKQVNVVLDGLEVGMNGRFPNPRRRINRKQNPYRRFRNLRPLVRPVHDAGQDPHRIGNEHIPGS